MKSFWSDNARVGKTGSIPSSCEAAVRNLERQGFQTFRGSHFWLFPGPETVQVQVVRPDLHHTPSFRLERSLVVCPSVGTENLDCQLAR